MEELRKVKEASEGNASHFCAEDEMETTVMKVCVSEMKGEGAFGKDMLDRVGNDRAIRGMW